MGREHRDIQLVYVFSTVKMILLEIEVKDLTLVLISLSSLHN